MKTALLIAWLMLPAQTTQSVTTEPIQLSSAQVSGLRNWIVATWEEANPSALSGLLLRRRDDERRCRAFITSFLTAAEITTLREADTPMTIDPMGIAADLSGAYVQRRLLEVTVPTESWDALMEDAANIVNAQDHHSGVTAADITRMIVQRESVLPEMNRVFMSVTYTDTPTTEQYLRNILDSS